MRKTTKIHILEHIEEAKTAIADKKCLFYPELNNSVMELMDLEIDSADEVWPLIGELLEELKPEYHIETDLKDFKAISPKSEFFTFVWNSQRLKKKVKLTFVLNGGHFYYFSLS